MRRRELLGVMGGAALASFALPVDAADFRFAAIADTGTGGKGQYAVAKILADAHARNPLGLVLLGGDNIYDNGEIKKISAVFERPYAPLLKTNVPFYAVLGNHDVRTNNGEDEMRYFKMPGRYYTFNGGGIQFFALDTNVNADWENQMHWLDQALNRSKTAIKIVYAHHPVYSSGHYGNNPRSVRDLAPILSAHKVTLYLNGHEHDYERTKLIDGVTYLTCGGGAGLRPVGQSKFTAISRSVLHCVTFERRGSKLILTALGTDGQAFDTATLG
jgi:3',5'-cyclic AMP phosphodiesterase CpdA